MRRVIAYACISITYVSLFFILSTSAYSWGFYAHKKINKEAVYALPAPLEAFYKKNIDFITLHAIDPDKHKYVDSSEAQRHFIDIDHYGANAFEALPKYWEAAINKYPKDTLTRYGTLPWEVLYWEAKLTEAFKTKDVNAILKASAYIGHYIADAHVPLHTITNYDGQMTEQEGIHSLWESAIPEAFGDKYHYAIGKAAYIKNPEDKIWEIVKQSHSLAASVLSTERTTNKGFTDATKFSSKDKKKYTPAYVSAYSKALNGMVEKQMQSSILDIAAFWYTAWVNGGQPDISSLR
jgi:hypothetical protein